MKLSYLALPNNRFWNLWFWKKDGFWK